MGLTNLYFLRTSSFLIISFTHEVEDYTLLSKITPTPNGTNQTIFPPNTGLTKSYQRRTNQTIFPSYISFFIISFTHEARITPEEEALSPKTSLFPS